MFSREQSACTVSFFLCSRLSLFLKEEGQPSASRGSRPTVAEARRGLNSWGSQAELADELEKGLSLSRSSAANEGERLDDDDAISLTSFDPAASALLGYAQEEQEMSKGEEAEAEPAQSSCPAYDELLEVMERATARLLGGNLESALETHCSFYAGLMMFWLSSMFHRNYLTDGPDSTLRTSPPGLVSCAGTMDG